MASTAQRTARLDTPGRQGAAERDRSGGSSDEGTPLGWIARVGWFAAIATLPVYPFPSGRPQPTDGLLALLALAGLVPLLRGHAPAARRSALALAAFVAVVVTVNAGWLIVTQSRDFLVTTLFYVFNLLVFAGTAAAAERHGQELARVVGMAAVVTLIAHAVVATFLSERSLGGRLHLFANNPNQLAYAVLGLASLVVVASRRATFPGWLTAIAGAAAAFVAFRTYSRAALLALAVLATVAVARRPGLVLALAVPALLVGLGLRDELADDELLRARLATVSEAGLDDYVEDRGIERVLEHPEHLFLGAGEGAHDRFHPLGLELHSSFATVAFSYGVLGVAALGTFAFTVVRGGSLRTIALLVPVALYGAFHNGLRFRVFWILLAVAGSVIARERRRSERSPVSRAGGADGAAAGRGEARDAQGC